MAKIPLLQPVFIILRAVAIIYLSTLLISIKAAGVNISSSSSPCYWSGTSPFCQGSCNIGEFANATSTKGDGWRCITGSKMYCCPTNDRRPNDKFMIPAILFGVRDHVKLIPIADLPTRKPIPS